MKVQEGDYVRIVEREVTPADLKSGLYYPFFGGVAGTVDKIYENGEAAVKVDLETLPAEMVKRHTEVQDSIKRKWLQGLSGEARNRLTPEEKRFTLAYALLVQDTDLEKATQGEVERAVAKTEATVIRASAKSLTSQDLDAAEEDFLRQRQEASQEE